MWILYLFLLLCFGSILCYFAHENFNSCGWMSFLDKIENDFLCFLAKFWLTAVLGFGCLASLFGILGNLFAAIE